MNVHNNAPLTRSGREAMVKRVLRTEDISRRKDLEPAELERRY